MNQDFKELLLILNNAFDDRVDATFGNVPVSVISREHLIRNKLSTGRLQDQADVEYLNAFEN